MASGSSVPGITIAGVEDNKWPGNGTRDISVLWTTSGWGSTKREVIVHTCIICGEDADITLGIRARYANTNAVWAPNLNAHLCDEHAKAGCHIALQIKPTYDGRVTTMIWGDDHSASQGLVIGTGRKLVLEQEELF
jgi:hypothetical protein